MYSQSSLKQTRMMRKPFNYFEVYDRHFQEACAKNTGLCSIVEIGVHSGGTLEFWPEVLQQYGLSKDNIAVTGVDIQPHVRNFSRK